MSAYATVAGLDVTRYRLTMPRWGPWVLEASMLDGSRPTTTQVDIVIGDTQLRGTVELAPSIYDTTVMRVRGGAGGLAKQAKPKHYRNASVRLVLSDLLATAGERLSSTSDADVVTQQLAQWTTIAQPVGRAMRTLLERLGDDISFRCLLDGSLWVGREKWSAVAPDFELIQVDPLDAAFTISSDVLVLPGDALQPRSDLAVQRIGYADHSMLDDEIRSRLYAVDAWT